MSLLHFVQSGIPNLYLSGGFVQKKTPYGDGVSFLDMKGLLRAAAIARAQIDAPLVGPEVKFLRHELGFSQAKLGEHLELNEQTIANWEKSKAALRRRDSLAIQLLVLQKLAPHISVARLASRGMPEKLTLSYSEGYGWHAQDAGAKVAFMPPRAPDIAQDGTAIREQFSFQSHITQAENDNYACEPAAA